jgi:hypothetical protein
MAALPSLVGFDVRAQIPAVKFDVKAARGLVVTPVYEGWYEADGKRYVLFGYYNRNLEEVLDVPVGPNNHLSPGPADQGQPTHFFPGLYYGMFVAMVPNDSPAVEVTWTLTVNGRTMSIPAFIDPLYLISPQKENGTEYPGNTPPVVKFDPKGEAGQGPRGVLTTRSAVAGRPLPLDVWVTDDGLPPAPRREPAAGARRTTPNRPEGLALSWQVYRGAGGVRFSDQMPPIEQGKAHTTATFSEPGEYMLQLVAVDSRSANRCCWTNAYVKVVVEAARP